MKRETRGEEKKGGFDQKKKRKSLIIEWDSRLETVCLTSESIKMIKNLNKSCRLCISDNRLRQKFFIEIRRRGNGKKMIIWNN